MVVVQIIRGRGGKGGGNIARREQHTHTHEGGDANKNNDMVEKGGELDRRRRKRESVSVVGGVNPLESLTQHNRS